MSHSVLSFVAGILVVQQFTILPGTIWIFVLIVLAGVLVYFRHWKLSFFIIGIVWAITVANNRLSDRLSDSLQGVHLDVEGEVVGLPQFDGRKVRFDFAVSKSNELLPEKIRLSWYYPKQQIKAGQHWQFTVKLKKPHGRFNPEGFDYERWLFVNNIGATGYVRKTPQPQKVATVSWWKSLSVVRETIAGRLEKMPVAIEHLGLIKALTIGDRHDLSQQQWDVFRRTGTVHLLAISGLHIGLVAGLIYFLVLNVGIRFAVASPQKMAAIAALLSALFYSALAGFSLPTQRSLLMLTIAMMAITWQRNIKPASTLALAMLGVLLVDPLAVLSAGFCLSFFAVAIIIYSMAGRLGKSGYWLTAFKIHWVTAIGLAPLLLYYFQQVSFIAPLSNFFTVPIISFLVVPLCLLAVVLMFFTPALAAQLFLMVDKILQGLWLVLSEMVELPYASIDSIIPPFYAIPLAMLGVFVLLMPKGVTIRWLGWVMFIPVIFVDTDKPDSGDFRLTLFDVGQGLSAVIETSQHTLVFDSGAKFSDQFDMGDAVVIPFLKNKRIDRVDTLLISHGDNDHIGGAESIIQQSDVRQILTSEPKRLAKYTPILCRAGQTWVWDQVNFEILSPANGALEGENNNSCVLKVRSKQGSVLLTGDIEKPAEEWLLNNAKQKLDSDVLIAPHHGSNTSSTGAFLKQVNPDIVLIPAGYRNKFSFPHKEVLERYKALNIDWMNTADQGALVVEATQNRRVVNSVRRSNRKYWNW